MSEQDEITTHSDICASLAASGSSGSGQFEIDFEKYLELTREFDATEEQQRELIAALWQIMMAFMDFKYGIHPVQSAMREGSAANLKDAANGANASAVLRSLIAQSDDLKEDFADFAGARD